MLHNSVKGNKIALVPCECAECMRVCSWICMSMYIYKHNFLEHRNVCVYPPHLLLRFLPHPLAVFPLKSPSLRPAISKQRSRPPDGVLFRMRSRCAPRVSSCEAPCVCVCFVRVEMYYVRIGPGRCSLADVRCVCVLHSRGESIEHIYECNIYCFLCVCCVCVCS